MKDNIRARAIISGRVQGVFFRFETQRAARSHAVSGWVKNRVDGTVEAVFEGSQESVEAVLTWCRQGPPHAAVTDVAVDWEPWTGRYETFEIRY